VPSDEIGLIVGEPAQFASSVLRPARADRPGELLFSWSSDELEETDSLETTLPAVEGMEEDYVPWLPFADHRTRRTGVVVRKHEEQEPVEAGVQRTGRCGEGITNFRSQISNFRLCRRSHAH